MKTRKKYLEIQSNQKITEYEVQIKTHQDKKHLVVPVVMIVEGVLNGSHGPLLHLAEEFGKFPESWNGIPVVINHPAKDGLSISANSPEVIDAITVGRVYNSHINSKRLMAEVWLEEEKLGKVSADVLSAVNARKPVEVSIGVFTEEEETPGVYEDVKYSAIARNHRPDHLALLPGAIGACSLEDGCGLGVNKEKEGEQTVDIVKQIQDLKELGFSVLTIVDNSETGLEEKLNELRDLVRTKNPDLSGGIAISNDYNYLVEAYDNYLIYENESKDGCKYYKQNYQFNVTSGEAELVGDPVEVERQVNYVIVNNINNNLKINIMADVCTPCVKKKVDALIANTAAGYAETDREMLETLSEVILDKMVPTTVEVEKMVEVNKLTPEDQAALDFGKKMLAKKKADMAGAIQKNTKDIWSIEVLNAMDEEMLERVFKSVEKPEEVDYSLNGNNRSFQTNRSDTEEKLLPPGVE